MVSAALWAQAGGPMAPGGFLCIGCLERRLGRELVSADFPTRLDINRPNPCDSSRLLERKMPTSSGVA